MRLSSNFITHSDGDEHILVSTGAADFSGIVKSNNSANSIIELLTEDTTEEKIVEKMLEKYDAPREIIERDVKKVVGQLREIGAVID